MAKVMQKVSVLLIGAAIAGLTGCDNSEEAAPAPALPAAVPVTVGGSVTGLPGSGLVLQLNGANELAVSANGKFRFLKTLTKGSAYSVTVKTSPSALIKQTCTVSNGNGNITGAPVNNISITCVTNTYAVGGTVSGLSGMGLVLQINGANDRAIAGNGKFIFPGIRLPDGSDYSVAIKTTPAKQKCMIKSINGAFDRDTLNIVSVTCSKKDRRK